MSERIVRRRPRIAEPLSARAVALCEGCPMAALCASMAVAPCETVTPRVEHIEQDGDYVAYGRDKPVVRSYRNELMNDAMPIVMADIRKKGEQNAQPTRHVRTAAQPPPRMPPPPTLPRVVRPQVTAVSERHRGESAGIVADILASMLGVHAIATSQTKKKV